MPNQDHDILTEINMSLDLMTDNDSKLFSDSILMSDDFNFEVEVDPSEYFLNSNEDLLQKISEDLEIPMLFSEIGHSDLNDDLKQLPFIPNLNDSTDVIIKEEPLSPNSSHSPSPLLTDVSDNSWSSSFTDKKTEWKILETPPVTPPQLSSDNSPPTTPKSYGQDVNENPSQVTQPSLSIVFTSPSIPLSNNKNCASNNSLNSAISANIITSSTVKSVPKIQPKNESSMKAEQPLVLTAEEFSKLTAQGVLRFKPPYVVGSSLQVNNLASTGKIQNISSAPHLGLSQPSTAVTIPSPSSSRKEIDLKALKRQQRMIKNRESACLSRKKKKEYVTDLEAQVKELMMENNQLKLENSNLKQRLIHLEKENEDVRRSLKIPTAKKTTAVLAILLMISFNLGPLSGIFLNNATHIQQIQETIVPHRSRSLLWANSNETSTWNNISHTNDSELQESLTFEDSSKFRNKSDISSRCPMYINKTESQRLDNNLRGWIFTEKKEMSKSINQAVQKKLPLPLPKLRSFVLDDVQPNKEYRPAYGNKGLQPYNFPTYDDFLDAIHREDDRFYVISFSGDHLLLPALSHNKTRRPFMSLVLPAIPLNETMQPPKDHVAMVQIDCEVTNTKLVHIREELVRNHLQKSNRTSYYPSVKKSNSKQYHSGKNNSSADKHQNLTSEDISKYNLDSSLLNK